MKIKLVFDVTDEELRALNASYGCEGPATDDTFLMFVESLVGSAISDLLEEYEENGAAAGETK